MLYEIYARSTNTEQLQSNNNRQVEAIFTLESNFNVLNGIIIGNAPAIFNKESKLVIKKAGIWINGAEGLRPALSLPGFQIAESYFGLLDRESTQRYFKCPEFGIYHNVNLEIDYSNTINRFYPQTARVWYDAFNIQTEYHGKDFSCICKMLVECSSLA